MPRLIRVPPGIGDNIWLLQKLINAKEKFDFQISNLKPQRGKQIFDLLPQVSNSCTYVDGLRYDSIKQAASGFKKSKWSVIKDKAFALEVNSHLEAGKRLEEYLPDLKITYKLPYITDGHGFEPWHLPEYNRPTKPKYIGIYTSAYSTVRSWNFWNERQWFDFVQKIHCEFHPGEVIFVIIGAFWDIDLSANLMKIFRENNIQYFDTIGKPLNYVIELLKALDYFIGFPSGLSIINETLHKPTMMFYPLHLANLRYAWPEEKRIHDYQYIAPLFCTPAEAFAEFADKSGMI